MYHFVGLCRFALNKPLAVQKERYERSNKKLGWAGLGWAGLGWAILLPSATED